MSSSLLRLAAAISVALLAFQTPVWAEKSKVETAGKKSSEKGPSSEERAESDALFNGLIPVLQIRIGEKDLEKLRKEPKEYVEATLIEPGRPPLEKVGLKLKGSVGSFQPIDQRPGFSLNLDKFGKRKVFHGLTRFQLNNCNQDPTALHELLSGQIARSAGVPASRCTHALVSLNGRNLGIYVLKEAFREELLGAFFKRTDGRLYDGGFCAEIRKDMELDFGPKENSPRLQELVTALAESNPDKQLQQLHSLIEVDAYLRHLALENILTHWDGYSFNRNNYRIYENPETGRFHFLLHGMDQTLTNTDWSIWRAPQAAVGSILWRDPAVQSRYQTLLGEICEKTLQSRDWVAFSEQAGARLLKACAAVDPQTAKAYEPRIAEAGNQLRARLAHITRQIQTGNPALLFSVGKPVPLGSREWTPQMQNAEGDAVEFDGKSCFRILAQPNAAGSWRLPLALPKGVYRFEAALRVENVVPVQDPKGEGAGLRTSGATRLNKNGLTGTHGWSPVTWEFESQGDTATLVVELRGQSGTVWIDRNSLRLTRVQ